MAPPISKSRRSLSDSEEERKRSRTRWRKEADRLSYSSKLLEALRQVRRSPPSAASAPTPSRSVREAADRVLAKAARGRTRWSRAILSRPVRLVRVGRRKSKKKALTWRLRPRERRSPALQKRVRALGRLVPGCRKVPLPVLVEEAADYVAALEMQVSAMRSLVERLSVAAHNQIGSASATSG